MPLDWVPNDNTFYFKPKHFELDNTPLSIHALAERGFIAKVTFDIAFKRLYAPGPEAYNELLKKEIQRHFYQWMKDNIKNNVGGIVVASALQYNDIMVGLFFETAEELAMFNLCFEKKIVLL